MPNYLQYSENREAMATLWCSSLCNLLEAQARPVIVEEAKAYQAHGQKNAKNRPWWELRCMIRSLSLFCANEQLAEIEKMLHRGGTKIIVISGNRKGVVGQYATEFLYAAGSEKVEEFWSSTFFASGKYLLDILYGMEFSRRYEENIALNSRYEKSGKNLLWRFSEKESD